MGKYSDGNPTPITTLMQRNDYPTDELGILIDLIGRIEFTLSSIRLYGFGCKSLDTTYNNLENNHIPANTAEK